MTWRISNQTANVVLATCETVEAARLWLISHLTPYYEGGYKDKIFGRGRGFEEDGFSEVRLLPHYGATVGLPGTDTEIHFSIVLVDS
jgi:hypothetical protein